MNNLRKAAWVQGSLGAGEQDSDEQPQLRKWQLALDLGLERVGSLMLTVSEHPSARQEHGWCNPLKYLLSTERNGWRAGYLCGSGVSVLSMQVIKKKYKPPKDIPDAFW